MILPETFKKASWDSDVFGVDAYEIVDISRESLEFAVRAPGHFTIRINPLLSKHLLHDYGFYYCDTLVEPYCVPERFVAFDSSDVSFSRNADLDELLKIGHGAFRHGRFHRDFNIDPFLADQRYDRWLGQLYTAGNIFGIFYYDELAGFIAAEGGKLVLHAVAESMRNRGLAKYFWTPVCHSLFDKGYRELSSSVSSANLAVVNLYCSLGFRFRNPVDIYHRLTK